MTPLGVIDRLRSVWLDFELILAGTRMNRAAMAFTGSGRI
jgi:hypothetical protein